MTGDRPFGGSRRGRPAPSRRPAEPRTAPGRTPTPAPAPVPAERILAERAERLARPSQPRETGRASFQALVFARGGERYALDTRHVRAVVGAGSITPVPGTADLLLGVTSLRGEVVAVFDLPRILAASTPEPGHGGHLVVLGEQSTEFALLADAVEGIENLDEGGLDRSTEARTGLPAIPLVRGITGSALVVLDGAALLTDEHLHLDADPERIT